jgi:hypothetical protein
VSTFPAATRADHARFCEIDDWEWRTSGCGRTGSDHVKYQLTLPDGRVLITRISHPPGRQTYGPSMWAHILRDQLDVDEATFWACVNKRVIPTRGAPPIPSASLPASLVHTLIHQVGLASEVVGTMTPEEAVARVNDYWTTPGDKGQTRH